MACVWAPATALAALSTPGCIEIEPLSTSPQGGPCSLQGGPCSLPGSHLGPTQRSLSTSQARHAVFGGLFPSPAHS